MNVDRAGIMSIVARDELAERLLLKEYEQRFNEKLFHMGRFHKQTDLIQLYFTVIIAVGAVVFSPRILHVRGDPVDFAWCAPLLGG